MSKKNNVIMEDSDIQDSIPDLEKKLAEFRSGNTKITSKLQIGELNRLVENQVELGMLLSEDEGAVSRATEFLSRALTFKGFKKDSRVKKLFSDQKEIINDLRNVVDNFSEHPAFRYFEDFEKYIAGYRQKVTQDYDAIVSKNIDAGSVIIGVIDMYSNLLIEMQFIEEKYPDFINRKELGKIKKSMHRCIDKTKFDYLDTWNNLQSLWTIVDAPIQKTTAIKNDLEFLQPIYESEEAMVVYIGKKDGHFDFLTSTVTRLYNNVKEGYNAKLG